MLSQYQGKESKVDFVFKDFIFGGRERLENYIISFDIKRRYYKKVMFEVLLTKRVIYYGEGLGGEVIEFLGCFVQMFLK